MRSSGRASIALARTRRTSEAAGPAVLMLRPVLRYGDAQLQRPARPVADLTPEIHTLIDDMVETMYGAPGIGLAAPQVGIDLRIFVIDLSLGRPGDDLVIMINPQFVEREGTQLEEEGCLSLPGFTATVARPVRALVSGVGRDGHEHRVEGRDLLARALQHEMDHLEGTLFVDRLRGITREVIVRRIGKLKRSGKW